VPSTACSSTAGAAPRSSSTTDTECTGSAITNRSRAFIRGGSQAILAVRPEVRTADPRGLGEFVACGCVLENRTLFAGLHVLPPSAAWVFRNGTLERKNSYFRARDWEDQEALEPEAYYRELRTVFSRNLSRYFEGGNESACPSREDSTLE